MRLRLTIPEDWTVKALGDQQIAIIAGTAEQWQVILAWGALVPFPDDPNQWVRRSMHVDVGAGAAVRAGASETLATETGWTVKLLDAEVVLTTGAVAEHRLGAFYQFMEYGAVALVRAKSRAALDAARPRLLEAITSGRPDWTGDGLITCLHDLFAPLG